MGWETNLISSLNRNLLESFHGGKEKLLKATSIDLSNIGINEIKADTFGDLTSLSILKISSNSFNRIEQDTFKGATNLTILELKLSSISHIADGAFENLSNLDELDLEHNQLENLSSGIFKGLNSLCILNLHLNRISSINEGAFVNLSALKELILASNEIVRIETWTFQKLTGLELLSLRGNKISEIAFNAFYSLSNLQVLSLRDNQLEIINSWTFRGLRNLKRLILSCNQISEIERNAFFDLKNLQHLHLDWNQLQRLESTTFQGLDKLESLMLGDNQIFEITQELFQGLKSIKLLHLDDQRCFCSFENLNRQHIISLSDWGKFLEQIPKSAGEKEQNFSKNFQALDKYKRYEQLGVLGTGGFGTAIQVRDKYSNLIKVMKLVERDDPATDNELEQLVNLKHGNILKYFEHFHHKIKTTMHTCIIVEYCEKDDLNDQINLARDSKEKKIPNGKILSWMSQAANGLRYIHSKKIVHRDIKPKNLLLTQQNVLKIADFGTSKILSNSKARTHVGTKPYMSPEQFNATDDKTYDFKADIWALGCVMYELIHLNQAFPEGPKDNDLVYRDMGIFSDTLLWLLRKDPDQRPDSSQLFVSLTDKSVSRNICRSLKGTVESVYKTGYFL